MIQGTSGPVKYRISSSVHGPLVPICDSIISNAAAYSEEPAAGAIHPFTQSAAGVAIASGLLDALEDGEDGVAVGANWLGVAVAGSVAVAVAEGVPTGALVAGEGMPIEGTATGTDAEVGADGVAAVHESALSARQAAAASATRIAGMICARSVAFQPLGIRFEASPEFLGAPICRPYRL